MKKNLKILITITILLLAVCIFNANVVQATNTINNGENTNKSTTNTITNTISNEENTNKSATNTNTTNTELQEILNLVPNTINLDILESEIFDDFKYEEKVHNKGISLIDEKIEKVFKDNKVDLNALNVEYLGFNFVDFYKDIHNIEISLRKKDDTTNVLSKNIKINYRNTANYNKEDEEYVLEIAKKIPDVMVITKNDVGNNEAIEFQRNLENVVNDKNIKIVSNYSVFAGSREIDLCMCMSFVGLYKNDVLYKYIPLKSIGFHLITIADDVQDTDEAYANYALPQIKKLWSEYEVGNIERITGEVVNYYHIDNNGTYYKAILDGNMSAIIVLKKDNTKKVADNVAITKESNVELKVTTIENNSETYNNMVNRAKEKGYSDVFIAYELKISEGDIKEDEGLSITFSLGTENDGKQAIVLHKKADGTYEEFIETIENGKITIKVTELSPFMVALKEEKKDNKELDDEPKTGVVDYKTFASIVTLVSLTGLVAIKLKKQ